MILNSRKTIRFGGRWLGSFVTTVIVFFALIPGEMLGTVPPTAIKYCVTKGWLVPNASASLYTITLKGGPLVLTVNSTGAPTRMWASWVSLKLAVTQTPGVTS